MRTINVLLVLLLLVGVGTVDVFAQEGEQELFSVNYQIIRVWESAFGFRLVIRSPDFTERDFFVPTRWIFADKIALVSYARSPSAPYLQAYYNNSEELQFFRLVLPRNLAHHTWQYDNEQGLREKFESASLNL